MARQKQSEENTTSRHKSIKKRVYRIKLEIDIFAMFNDNDKRIERGLQISLKDSETYFNQFDDDNFLKQYLEDEFNFYSTNRCFDDLKVFMAMQRRELGFNQVGKREDREELIQKWLQAFEKRLRKKYKAVRGAPKQKKYSVIELLTQKIPANFIDQVAEAVFDMQKESDKKLTKTAIAEKLFPNHSNALLAFNRKLEEYSLSYDNLIKSILEEEYIYEDKIKPLLENRK